MGRASVDSSVLDVALYRLSIPFAIVTGCAAGLLAVLTWETLRNSPFGLSLKLLAVVMSIGTVYHAGLFVFGSETVVLQLLLVLGYVLVVVTLFTAVSGFDVEVRSVDTFRHKHVLGVTVLGVLLYAIGGPLSEVFVPELLHWVHGFAALFAMVGLYTTIHDDLRRESWDELLLDDGREGGHSAEWMMPMDVAILDLLESSGLVLTPAVIAYNTGYSRDEVNRRLTKLEAEELVERVERGKYRLTEDGDRTTPN